MRAKYDVVIAGAGMVGACAALALARRGFRVALLDPQSLPAVEERADASYDLRVSAISPASQRLLAQLGVWQALDHQRVCDYQQMKVWHENGDANLQFDCADLGKESLGSIVENNQLLFALHHACQARSEIDWFVPDAIAELVHNSAQQLSLRLQSGIRIEAELLLAADGRNSTTRTMAGLDKTAGDYQQTAIVANMGCEYTHQATAWQRFLHTGPLALLPLANGEVSIVWSCDTALAENLLALDDEGFCAAVTEASERRLGAITSVGNRLNFRLGWHSCEQWLQQRVLLIGDAAHSVHPLAGQGLNLGFADIDALIHSLAGLEQPWNRKRLRQFERQRKSETAIATHLFSALKWVYGSRHPALDYARDLGMRQLQANRWCKRLLIKQAMENMA